MDQLILHITRIGRGKGGGNRAVAYNACILAVVGDSDRDRAAEFFALIDFELKELQPLGAVLGQAHTHILGRLSVAVAGVRIGAAFRHQVGRCEGTDLGPFEVVRGNLNNGSRRAVPASKDQLHFVGIDDVGVFHRDRLAHALCAVGPHLGVIVAVGQVAQRVVCRLIQLYAAGGAHKLCDGPQAPGQRICAEGDCFAGVVLDADKRRFRHLFAGIGGPGLSIHGGFERQALGRRIGKPGQGADLVEDHADVFIALEDNAFQAGNGNRAACIRDGEVRLRNVGE